MSDVEIVDAEPVFDVVPYTGEAITVRDMSDEQLAALIDDAKDFAQVQLSPFQRGLKDEALRRMDEAAARGERSAWTFRAGPWKVEGESPDRTDYDVDETKRVLLDLATRGLIDEAAVKTVIVPKGWQVSKSGIKQLTKLGGEVKEALEACAHPSTRPRNLSVSRA